MSARDAAIVSVVSFKFLMECSKMTDYVLIHGAWRGSWCWKRVRHLMTAGGHRIFTPTLTGLGERVHLLSRNVGLDTHIADVANLLLWEDLRDIVLVGHSYGGIVARHVADRLQDRVRSLVYLDAFVPEDGKSLVDHLTDSGKRYREQALAQGNGWKVPPPPSVTFWRGPGTALSDSFTTLQRSAAGGGRNLSAGTT
jgi:pimeloyl-ACP methyl ester carboxylesterase